MGLAACQRKGPQLLNPSSAPIDVGTRTSPVKLQPQRELYLPIRSLRCGHGAGACHTRRRVGKAKLRMVQRVEKLSAQLELACSPQLEALGHRQIEVVECFSVRLVPSQHAPGKCRRSGESRRIEPAMDVPIPKISVRAGRKDMRLGCHQVAAFDTVIAREADLVAADVVIERVWNHHAAPVRRESGEQSVLGRKLVVARARRPVQAALLGWTVNVLVG
jgi:hypothetical protein